MFLKCRHTFLLVSFCSCGASVAAPDVCDAEVEVSSSSDAATRLPEPVHTSPFTSQVTFKSFWDVVQVYRFVPTLRLNRRGVFRFADCEGRDRQRFRQRIPESDGVISTKSACRKVQIKGADFHRVLADEGIS